MAEALFNEGVHETPVTFDLFYRKNPYGGGYAVFAGLDTFLRALNEWNYTHGDKAFLEENYGEPFCRYLYDMDMNDIEIRSLEEGAIMLPNLPVMVFKGPLIKLILIETVLLNCINHQSLIATKASRVRYAAKDKTLSEFGARRATGMDAAFYGSRATYLAGFNSTSLMSQYEYFKIPTSGTMAHLLPMFFEDDKKAFNVFARNISASKGSTMQQFFVIDTYDTLDSGIYDAVDVFRRLKAEGKLSESYGVRLDSGDLAALSLKVRKVLDNEGFPDAKIIVSNDLDEYLIQLFESSDAGGKPYSAIDIYGVGTKLITSDGCSSLGAVYKLSSVDGKPRMKFSNNIEKTTNPGEKSVWHFSLKTGETLCYYISMIDEQPRPINGNFKFYDPQDPDIDYTVKAHDVTVEESLVNVNVQQYVAKSPHESLLRARSAFFQHFNALQESVKRFQNPDMIPVFLSDKLWDTKRRLKAELKEKNRLKRHLHPPKM